MALGEAFGRSDFVERCGPYGEDRIHPAARTRDRLQQGVLRSWIDGPRARQAGLAGVAPNTLSARLKTLEKQGVIGTRLYEQHPPRFEYFLTDKGQALGPVLKALYKWGERYG
jgi:hypothetical protein